MSRFNPDFWEVTLAADRLDRIAEKDALWYESPEDGRQRQCRHGRTRAVWPQVRTLIDQVLTPRQRQIVLLFFFEELNQRQIAERLGISQQAVSEHLYGKTRQGRTEGGALRKLRKACARQGIQWTW